MKTSILVVDDEARMRRLLEMFLKNLGHEVVQAGDGSEALACFEAAPFDLVMTDLKMPRMGGLALLKAMEQQTPDVLAVIMTGFIYPIQGFWKWGGGFLDQAGFLDFAGSGVVHMCGAAAALAGVILLGARKGKYGPGGQINAIPGCNLPLATLGAWVLWLGWFGFNGGSELKISNVDEANAVARIFVNTNMAAAGGLVVALITARFRFGKADLTMALNGALAGLVAITADPLSPAPLSATMIGAVGGLLVVGSIVMLDKLRIDDPVGAISVHGVVGIWGVLAVLFNNGEATFVGQVVGIAAIFFWTFTASFVVWFIIKKTLGIRVSEEEEYEGVDLGECGLEAYPEFTTAE